MGILSDIIQSIGDVVASVARLGANLLKGAWWLVTRPIVIAQSILEFFGFLQPDAISESKAIRREAKTAMEVNEALTKESAAGLERNLGIRRTLAKEVAPAAVKQDAALANGRDWWRACRALRDGRDLPESLELGVSRDALVKWARTDEGQRIVSAVARANSGSSDVRDTLARLPGMLEQMERSVDARSERAQHPAPRLVYDADEEERVYRLAAA
jgi:hypothetical protein